MGYRSAFHFIVLNLFDFYYRFFHQYTSRAFKIFIGTVSERTNIRQGWQRRLITNVIKFGAKAGVAECSLTLGKAYLNNRIFPRSDYDAAYWLYKSALLGNSEAQYLLGLLYLSGLPMERVSSEYLGTPWSQPKRPSLEEGTRWLKRASDQGHAPASGKLGDILINGPQNIRNIGEGLRLLLFAAKKDVQLAQFILGNYFIGIAADDESIRRVAAAYVFRSASQGYPSAVYVKGLLLESGFGIARDRKAAAQCFKVASEFNIPEALRSYAKELISGEFVAKNILLAETILRKSARAGDVESAKMLSQYYTDGLFFHKNQIEASFWKQRVLSVHHKTILTP